MQTFRQMTRRRKIIIGLVAFFAVLIIIGAVNSGHDTPAPGGTSTNLATASSVVTEPRVPSATARGETSSSSSRPSLRVTPTVTRPVAPPAPTKSIKEHAPAPVPPVTTKKQSSAPAVVPPVTTAAAAGCHPLTNAGHCYEPGEFCRDSDHGISGTAGDGKAITCKDNNGWRWED